MMRFLFGYNTGAATSIVGRDAPGAPLKKKKKKHPATPPFTVVGRDAPDAPLKKIKNSRIGSFLGHLVCYARFIRVYQGLSVSKDLSDEIHLGFIVCYNIIKLSIIRRRADCALYRDLCWRRRTGFRS